MWLAVLAKHISQFHTQARVFRYRRTTTCMIFGIGIGRLSGGISVTLYIVINIYYLNAGTETKKWAELLHQEGKENSEYRNQ